MHVLFLACSPSLQIINLATNDTSSTTLWIRQEESKIFYVHQTWVIPFYLHRERERETLLNPKFVWQAWTQNLLNGWTSRVKLNVRAVLSSVSPMLEWFHDLGFAHQGYTRTTHGSFHPAQWIAKLSSKLKKKNDRRLQSADHVTTKSMLCVSFFM